MSGKDKLFVEQRPEKDYAVRKGNSERASAVLPTQKEAIERARELNPGHSPDVERVGTRTGENPTNGVRHSHDGGSKKFFYSSRSLFWRLPLLYGIQPPPHVLQKCHGEMS